MSAVGGGGGGDDRMTSDTGAKKGVGEMNVVRIIAPFTCHSSYSPLVFQQQETIWKNKDARRTYTTKQWNKCVGARNKNR